MKVVKILINISIPIFLLMLFASLLTTKSYLMLSEGLYSSHDDITFDHEYASERIMGYLNYKYDNLEFGNNEFDDSVIMRQIEIDHMVDVKNLYTTLRIIALGCIVVGGSLSVYLYKKDKKQLYSAYKTLPLGPVFFTMFVGGYVIIDFNAAFDIFHNIFFSNNDWQLRSTDVLIQLLPLNFWMVSGIIILTLFMFSMGMLYYINEKYIKKSADL